MWPINPIEKVSFVEMEAKKSNTVCQIIYIDYRLCAATTTDGAVVDVTTIYYILHVKHDRDSYKDISRGVSYFPPRLVHKKG